jgi:hypothetical protein
MGAGVESNFGADGDWWEGIELGMDLDVMVGDDTEGSDIVLSVVIDVLNPGNL